MRSRLYMLLTLALTGWVPATAANAPAGFVVEVLVDGRPVPEYAARGARYVEALEGKEYAIRLRNPLGVRVAVALSVDGLNTIDAQRTSAPGAQKWVLEPYETVTISGWQTSRDHARRFYFTSEERSYAVWLGETANIGVISAVFFRERVAQPHPVTSPPAPSEAAREQSKSAPATPSPAAEGSPRESSPSEVAGARRSRQDEYAATGIGRETDHRVRQVWLDLDPRPVASVDLRYEYRPQLVRLGVLPPHHAADPLSRRERARGFEGGFCPVPR